MTLKERLEQLREMDFDDKTKKDFADESIIANILDRAKNGIKPTYEICLDLMVENAKMYRRMLLTKSEYNQRRNAIERILFNK